VNLPGRSGQLQGVRIEPDAEIVASSLTVPERFEVIFDRHFPTIHSYLARRVGETLADDLASATFVEAFRARHRFQMEHASARPWLFGIASNMIRQHRRGERRRLLAYAKIMSEPAADDTEAVESRLDAEVIVGPALASLAAPDRDALLLLVWGELTYEEVAEALSIPVGTVKSRINRARSLVRASLAAGGFEAGDREPRDVKEASHG